MFVTISILLKDTCRITFWVGISLDDNQRHLQAYLSTQHCEIETLPNVARTVIVYNTETLHVSKPEVC